MFVLLNVLCLWSTFQSIHPPTHPYTRVLLHIQSRSHPAFPSLQYVGRARERGIYSAYTYSGVVRSLVLAGHLQYNTSACMRSCYMSGTNMVLWPDMCPARPGQARPSLRHCTHILHSTSTSSAAHTIKWVSSTHTVLSIC